MTSVVHGGFGSPAAGDRRPWIWVASIVSCAYSLLTLSARLLAKWELVGVEDATVSAAYVRYSAGLRTLTVRLIVSAASRSSPLGNL